MPGPGPTAKVMSPFSSPCCPEIVAQKREVEHLETTAKSESLGTNDSRDASVHHRDDRFRD